MKIDSLFHLLQLVSPALPVGAYSYSEGLESLIEQQTLDTADSLQQWLTQELRYGSIRLETAVMLRSWQCTLDKDWEKLNYWNNWLSATRETQELREQSWQMGQSLFRLLTTLDLVYKSTLGQMTLPINYAISFGTVAAHWQIEAETAVMGYLYSWLANLVSAGVRLIPLGQTQGQQILLSLHLCLEKTGNEILRLSDEELSSCNWGLFFASTAHESQYTRLFRS